MDEEVNRDENDEADGLNLEVDSKDETSASCIVTCVKNRRDIRLVITFFHDRYRWYIHI